MMVANMTDQKPREIEIEKLVKQGWRLCLGCGNYFSEHDEICAKCTVDTMKFYGLPPWLRSES
jgi:uncharacterized OB-fold protein